jgi:sarcosine oxidase subunit gamma
MSKPGFQAGFKPYAQSPLHAFGLAALARPQEPGCGVWMNEAPLLGYIILRGDSRDQDFSAAAGAVLGIGLPAAGRFAACAHGVVLWQGPDEWLLVCARAKRAALQKQLETALGAVHAQVADNSGGLTQVYLSGTSHVELLRHVGVYDFESIVPGRVVGTVLGKTAILVYRHDEEGLFVVFRRSFADYVWRMLEKAARPYGLGICELAVRPVHPVLRLLQE